jgi:hypothetical protein
MATAAVALVIIFIPICAYIDIQAGKHRAAANVGHIEQYRPAKPFNPQFRHFPWRSVAGIPPAEFG